MKHKIVVTPASKEETKELEHTTQHLSNFLNAEHYGGLFGRLKHLWYLDQYSDLVSWYHCHNMLPPPTVPLRKHIAKLSELLGYRPTYHAVRGSGGYQNAIWGFHFESAGVPFDVVIYLSTRGLTIQARGLTPKTHQTLLAWLKKRLLPVGFKSFRDWYRKNHKEALS